VRRAVVLARGGGPLCSGAPACTVSLLLDTDPQALEFPPSEHWLVAIHTLTNMPRTHQHSVWCARAHRRSVITPAPHSNFGLTVLKLITWPPLFSFSARGQSHSAANQQRLLHRLSCRRKRPIVAAHCRQGSYQSHNPYWGQESHHTHLYIYIYIYIYIYVYVYVCMYVFMCVCVCLCIDVCGYIYVYLCLFLFCILCK
jgi:hypothetical protein